MSTDTEVTLEMADAGGREAKHLLDDPLFLQKPNWAGELASRVFQAMQNADTRQVEQYSGPWLWDADKSHWYRIEEPANWIATTDANLASVQSRAMG